MKKQSQEGSGKMLLLAGLGIGALLLFSGKARARPVAQPTEPDDPAAIPEAPKILAVNASATESPAPTGMVSDEEGMEAVAASDEKESAGGGDPDTAPATAEYTASGDGLPAIVSTTLTAKEKAIIEKGPLTPALAIKRPDLYKAAYVKRYGGSTTESKRKALRFASTAIRTAVSDAHTVTNGGLVTAVRYPAKAEYTFVQSAGGMSNQLQVEHMAKLGASGVKVSAAARKVASNIKRTKAGKTRRHAKTNHTPVTQRAHKKRTTVRKAGVPLKKQIIKK